MEEKERYSWYNHSTEEIYDNKDDVVFVGAITVLNQQNRRIWELIEENKQLKQSQNQKAIEELNNLKRYCHEWYSWSDVAKRLDVVVDDRIKELKGEKNE